MLAVELGPDKIRVNVICPGAIDTEIGDNTSANNAEVKIPVEYPKGNIPLTGGKPGSAEQVGELIAFLAPMRPAISAAPRYGSTVPNPCLKAEGPRAYLPAGQVEVGGFGGSPTHGRRDRRYCRGRHARVLACQT
jgi:hypothetical protein